MVNCPLCYSSNYQVYIEQAKELYNGMNEYFNLYKCKECGHIFTNPRPTIDTMEYFYPDNAGYYKPYKYKKASGFKYEIYKQILNIFYGYNLPTAANKFLSILVYLLRKRQLEVTHIPTFKQNGHLLDIGSSYGAYLKRKQEIGWKIYGIELNKKAVKYAKTELGIKNIKSDFFENIEYQDNFFDVANMNMVLEHVHEPPFVIQKINKLLNVGGQLMISVPDISGFESKFYKQNFYGLQVPQHLHHFSPQTITRLLENNGFKIEKIIHQNFDRDLVASAGYMRNKTLSRIISNKFVRKTFIKCFVSFLALIGKTSRMSIYARKVK